MSALSDLKELVELVKAKGEVGAFEKAVPELTAILADMLVCMEKRESGEQSHGSAPEVNVTVSPTPIEVHVAPAAVTVQGQSWSTLNVLDPAGNVKFSITRNA